MSPSEKHHFYTQVPTHPMAVRPYLVISQSGTFPASHISRIAIMSPSSLPPAGPDRTSDSEVDALHLRRQSTCRGPCAMPRLDIDGQGTLWPSSAVCAGTERGAAHTKPRCALEAHEVAASSGSGQSASVCIMRLLDQYSCSILLLNTPSVNRVMTTPSSRRLTWFRKNIENRDTTTYDNGLKFTLGEIICFL